MRIEVWGDVICPWCALGDQRLRLALSRFEHAGAVEVVRRSFQLDPTAPEGVGVASAEMLAANGFDASQIAAMTGRVEQLGAADGLAPFRVAEAMAGSTGLVHELLAHAASTGVGDAAWQGAYRAQFGEGRDIFTVAGLVALAGDLGLDSDEIRAVLTDRRHREQVAADQAAAARLGVRGVPTMLIDGRVAISGAQPVDVVLGALQAASSRTVRPSEGLAVAS